MWVCRDAIALLSSANNPQGGVWLVRAMSYEIGSLAIAKIVAVNLGIVKAEERSAMASLNIPTLLGCDQSTGTSICFIPPQSTGTYNTPWKTKPVSKQVTLKKLKLFCYYARKKKKFNHWAKLASYNHLLPCDLAMDQLFHKLIALTSPLEAQPAC